MLRVVLIDDEKVVLNGMTAILKKEKNIALVGTADNGKDGLDLILDKRPEIVLTDIRMPGLSGLEMIKKAREVLPDTIYIIFSGFNEFRYVKEAIGLGVIDYLEKPITVSDLQKVLEKAAQIYNYKQEYLNMIVHLQKAERVYVEQALRGLYEHSVEEGRYLKKILEYNSALEFAKAFCVVKVDNRNSHTIEDYRSIVKRLTFDLIDKKNIVVYTFYDREHLVVTYFRFEEEDFPFLEKICQQKKILEEEEVNCFVGVSLIHNRILELRDAFMEADSALDYAAYLEKGEPVSIDSVEYQDHIPRDLKSDQKSIGFNFRMGQYDLCQKQAEEYLAYLGNLNLLPELMRQKCQELIFLMKKLFEEVGFSQEPDTGYSEPGERSSVEDYVEWTKEKVCEILDKARENSAGRRSRVIDIVKKYMESHYQEGLSLESVAEQVHMSPTYLSMLFKREEGITYIRYLTKVRMEQAMRYIQEGYRAKQICEMVGYHDYKYFSNQFKAHTGMTIDAYKKSI